jgi:hypothetical protein
MILESRLIIKNITNLKGRMIELSFMLFYLLISKLGNVVKYFDLIYIIVQ